MLKKYLFLSMVTFPIAIYANENTTNAMPTTENIIDVCADCHGTQGISKGKTIPNLWGQSEDYLYEQASNFKYNKRKSTFMDALIYQISSDDLRKAAQHYAAQPAALIFELQWRGDKWPGDMSVGEQIAYTGKPLKNIPACVACHGPNGVGVLPSFPRLGGQDKHYLINQLTAWKNDARPVGTLSVMPNIAKSLSNDEIKAVALYFSQQGVQK